MRAPSGSGTGGGSGVVATAFLTALRDLASWYPEPADRPPAFDVWGPATSAGPPAAPEPSAALVTQAVSTLGRGAIRSAARAVRAGESSCVALVERALEVVKRDSERLGALVHVDADGALAAARERDRELRTGRDRGVLHGLPVSVKDVIHVAGMPTRAGSLAFRHLSAQDAWAVARLRAAGAVILGKAATHELALGVTSPQSRNPHDLSRIPGGSSGGSAVAVATGMGLASLGTDTRASTRIPAALCGIVGLKPTYGTIPTSGLVPLSWTMDHVGLLAPTVDDVALLLAVLTPSADKAWSSPPAAPRIGVPGAAFDGCDADVLEAAEAALEGLRLRGARLAPVASPTAADFEAANSMGLLVSRCEAAAYHRRIGTDHDLLWSETREQLEAAEKVRACDYLDAQRYRAELRERMFAALEGLDALAMPTSPVTAPPVKEAERYLTVLSRNVILWSFVGFPAISIPCGCDSEGLPIGLQLVGRPGEDAQLLALARLAETGATAA